MAKLVLPSENRPEFPLKDLSAHPHIPPSECTFASPPPPPLPIPHPGCKQHDTATAIKTIISAAPTAIPFQIAPAPPKEGEEEEEEEVVEARGARYEGVSRL